MLLKKGLNGVFLEWLYTTAATYPFPDRTCFSFLIDFLRPFESINCCLPIVVQIKERFKSFAVAE